MTQGKDKSLFPDGNNSQNKVDKTVHLRPWQPGQSGNPGGRPVMPPEVKEALMAATLPAMRRLVALIDSGDERISLLASQAVLDRAFGKAAQAVDKNVTVTSVQQQHLNVLLELQAKRDAAAKAIDVTPAEVENKPKRGS